MVRVRSVSKHSTSYRHMVYPCKMTKVKFILLVFNICYAAISVLLFIAGGILMSGKSGYGSELAFLRDHLDTAANAIGATNLSESNLDIAFITYPMGVTFIVVSLVTLAVAALGIAVAVNKRSHALLIAYCVITAGVVFAQNVLIICSYIDKEPFETNVKRMLKQSLKDFTGIDGEDSLTLGWNAIMSYKSCCGVDGYEDFQVSLGWVKAINGGGKFDKIRIPFMCCKDGAEVPNCVRQGSFMERTNHDKGCYEAIWDMAISDHGYVICFVFFLLVIEFFCLFMGVWNICEVKTRRLTRAKVHGRP